MYQRHLEIRLIETESGVQIGDPVSHYLMEQGFGFFEMEVFGSRWTGLHTVLNIPNTSELLALKWL